MSTLAIDFDGVLHDDKHPLEGKSLGPPIQDARNAICYLRNELGHKIIIFSVKPPDIIEDWLHYYEIPFDRITMQKPIADLYLDDKAVRFSSWDIFLRTISLYLGKEFA